MLFRYKIQFSSLINETVIQHTSYVDLKKKYRNMTENLEFCPEFCPSNIEF